MRRRNPATMPLEISVLANKVSFRVHFDSNTFAASNVHGHKTLCRSTAGFLGSFGQTFGAQPVNSSFHVAICFVNAFLASIMPAPVLSRSSFTIAAVIAI